MRAAGVAGVEPERLADADDLADHDDRRVCGALVLGARLRHQRTRDRRGIGNAAELDVGLVLTDDAVRLPLAALGVLHGDGRAGFSGIVKDKARDIAGAGPQIEDPQLRAGMAKNARQRVVDRSWPSAFRKFWAMTEG